jgi:hypothetical protein
MTTKNPDLQKLTPSERPDAQRLNADHLSALIGNLSRDPRLFTMFRELISRRDFKMAYMGELSKRCSHLVVEQIQQVYHQVGANLFRQLVELSIASPEQLTAIEHDLVIRRSRAANELPNSSPATTSDPKSAHTAGVLVVDPRFKGRERNPEEAAALVQQLSEDDKLFSLYRLCQSDSKPKHSFMDEIEERLSDFPRLQVSHITMAVGTVFIRRLSELIEHSPNLVTTNESEFVTQIKELSARRGKPLW